MTRTRSPGGRVGLCAQKNPFVWFLSEGRITCRTMDNRFLHTKQAGLRNTYKYLEVISVHKKKTSFEDEYFCAEAQNAPAQLSLIYFGLNKYKITILFCQHAYLCITSTEFD